MATLAAGCAQPVAIAPNLAQASNPDNRSYSVEPWANVLRQCVRQGLVDYDALREDPASLERYYAMLSVTGPATTPEQFNTRSDRTAYWINAFNACVLRAVLERYPTPTMYDLAMPRLEHEYTFMVDGAPRTLAEMEREILSISDGDVRALFATSRAAMGTPRVPSEPIRPQSLERQITEAAADALDNPRLLRIDHTEETILVWQIILKYEREFVQFWRDRRRARSAYLFNVLRELASPRRQRALQSAVGYRIKQIPFDRSLNNWGGPGRVP